MPLRRIASGDAHLYLAGMAATLFRLLALFALVLMPFTMAGTAVEAHAMPSAEAHCGEHPDEPAPPATDIAQCMLMCAALPASETVAATPAQLPKPPRSLALARPIPGIILEIATPPPRSA